MYGEWSIIIEHVLLQGLIYSLVVMGVYLSSRVIRFDDLTTEGSFGIGSAAATVGIVVGMTPWLTIPLAMGCGALAGMATSMLHARCQLNPLICGLIVTTALFSVCLKGAGANQSLYQYKTLFLPSVPSYLVLMMIGALVLTAFLGLKFLLRSELGLVLRALGNNPHMLTQLGKSVHLYKMLGLMVSNSLVALAGALLVHWNGFFSITANVGTLIIGLIGLMLSEIFKSGFSVSLIMGAILYQAIFSVTIELELDPVWNNLIKAILIVALIQIKNFRKSVQERV